MIRLAHLSDIHLGPLPEMRFGELLGKRVTGYVNWRLARSRHLQRDTLSGLVAHLTGMMPDLIAVSGDLVNLATRAEFSMTAAWLRTLGPSGRVAVIPGNHDAYVPGALRVAETEWGDYMRGETIGDATFPYVRRMGEVALICCSSAVTRPPFFASGRFDAEQGRRLAAWLKRLGEMRLFRAVMIHHPPVGAEAHDKRRGLAGASYFTDAIAEEGAELVLHGHLHKTSIAATPGPAGEVPVLGVASASADAAHGAEPARYNLFEIERLGRGFSCTLSEYGYQRVGEDVVRRLKMRLS